MPVLFFLMKIKENHYLSHEHFNTLTLGKQTNKKMSKVKLMKGCWERFSSYQF